MKQKKITNGINIYSIVFSMLVSLHLIFQSFDTMLQ